VVPSAPAPMQGVPSAGLPSKPAYNPVLANLGIRVGASMNQAVSCYAHGALYPPHYNSDASCKFRSERFLL
jgi:hypothetical protein